MMINRIPDSIEQYFYNLTTHQPYNFQTQTITRILNLQDTILRAPTGSGKTETAIAPFLFAKTLNLDFPNKLIYVVPFDLYAPFSMTDRKYTLKASSKGFCDRC